MNIRLQIPALLWAALLCGGSTAVLAQQASPARTATDLTQGLREPVPEELPARTRQTLQRYVDALRTTVERHWIRPASLTSEMVCPVAIRQLPGGEVIALQALPECQFDANGRRSVEAAILKAQPLPYHGYESVFQRTIVIRFRPKKDVSTAR